MIVSLRGTSGSGKTTIARALMDKLQFERDLRDETLKGADQLVGHCYHGLEMPLFVVGRYNVASGGCDKIYNRERQFEYIRRWAELGHVFYEGMQIANEVNRTAAIAKEHETHVIFLSTPIEECIAAINERRRLKGNNEPVDPKNTAGKRRELTERILPRMRAAGVDSHFLSREEARDKVFELLTMGGVR